MTLQETDREEDEKKARAILVSRRGRTTAINVCKWKWVVPAGNPEVAKSS